MVTLILVWGFFLQEKRTVFCCLQMFDLYSILVIVIGPKRVLCSQLCSFPTSQRSRDQINLRLWMYFVICLYDLFDNNFHSFHDKQWFLKLDSFFRLYRLFWGKFLWTALLSIFSPRLKSPSSCLRCTKELKTIRNYKKKLNWKKRTGRMIYVPTDDCLNLGENVFNVTLQEIFDIVCSFGRSFVRYLVLFNIRICLGNVCDVSSFPNCGKYFYIRAVRLVWRRENFVLSILNEH